jgi:hypothetical protein
MRTPVLIALLAGCNHAPTWTIAPQQVKQGQSVSLPLAPADSDGDSVEVQVASAPDGLTAESDGKMLTLHAGYQVSGTQELRLRLDDHHGGMTEVPITVEVAPIAWKWTVNFDMPTAREHGSLVVDEERDQVYLLGGSGYAPQGQPAVDEYWTWDRAARTWTALVPTGSLPPPAASRRAAPVPAQKRAYLFGGYTDNGVDSDELYRFDYSSLPPVFTRITQVNTPSARELHAFVYDPAGDQFVLFGGIHNAVLGDTWTMKISGDTATWTKQMITGPTPRYGFFYGMGGMGGMAGTTLYVWSGATQPASIKPAGDTWALDVTTLTWSQILDGSEAGAPPGRRNGAFVYDPDAERLVIFGGTADAATTVPGLSFLDLRRREWATVTLADQPPLRSSSFGFYDGKRQQSVLGFGNDRGLYRDFSALGY